LKIQKKKREKGKGKEEKGGKKGRRRTGHTRQHSI